MAKRCSIRLGVWLSAVEEKGSNERPSIMTKQRRIRGAKLNPNWLYTACKFFFVWSGGRGLLETVCIRSASHIRRCRWGWESVHGWLYLRRGWWFRRAWMHASVGQCSWVSLSVLWVYMFLAELLDNSKRKQLISGVTRISWIEGYALVFLFLRRLFVQKWARTALGFSFGLLLLKRGVRWQCFRRRVGAWGGCGSRDKDESTWVG